MAATTGSAGTSVDVAALAPAAPAALSALRRADHNWCQDTADEPLDAPRLDHLAAAVQARLDSAAPAVDVDEHQAELDRVRAFEEQRREDLRVELWKHIDVQQRRAERAERERDEHLAKVDQLRAHIVDHQHMRETISAQLTTALREADTWEGEYERVVDDKLVELTDALEARDRARVERDQALAEVEQLRALKVAAEASTRPGHRHAWEVQPGLKPMPLPCSCGKPWPRNRPPIVY